jgi:hypothetical protein
MLDDHKKSERVTIWLTEREFVDLSRLAAKDDRKQSEMARVILRRSMYGTIGSDTQDGKQANSGDSPHEI